MPAAKQRFLDLLATGRVANLPSVLSNTFLGAILAWWLSDAFDLDQHLPYSPSLLAPLLTAVCFYLGGCFLNDWHDAGWDRRHRPERAIPSGRTARMTVGAIAFSLLGAGLALGFLAGWATGVLGLCILLTIAIYTIVHKRSAWAVLVMGLCRALLYPLGFLAQPEPVNLPASYPPFHFSLFEAETKIVLLVVLGVGLLSYVAGLSLIARHEATGAALRGNTRLLAFCLICLPLLTHTCIWASGQPLTIFAGILPFACLLLLPLLRPTSTTTRRVSLLLSSSTTRRVDLLLASIPLIDFIAIPALAQAISLSAHLSTHTIHPAHHPLASIHLLCAIPLAAYILARLLQRVAPAT